MRVPSRSYLTAEPGIGISFLWLSTERHRSQVGGYQRRRMTALVHGLVPLERVPFRLTAGALGVFPSNDPRTGIRCLRAGYIAGRLLGNRLGLRGSRE